MTKTNSIKAKKILNNAVTVWFIIAVIGQWIFATYVILFYGKATATGHNENWSKVLPHGYISGETRGDKWFYWCIDWLNENGFGIETKKQ